MASSNSNKSDKHNQHATTEEIMSVLPDLLFEMTADGRYAAFHAGRRDDLYVNPEEFLGKTVSEVLPEPVAEKFEQALQQIHDTGEETSIRYLLPIRDEMQFFFCRLIPLDGKDRILVQIRNITEAWKVQNELERSEARYRTLVNNIPGLVYRCHVDDEWTPIFVSNAVEEMFGYPVGDFEEGGRTLASLLHPEDYQRVHHEVQQAVEQRRPYRVSHRMVGADGQVHHMSEQGRAVYSESGQPEYLDGVVFDVSEMHRMRQRLLVNSKMAAVGNLAAGVAHEINNPLTIAMANLEYVDEEMSTINSATDDDSPIAEALEDVNLAVGKVQEGIDRVRSIVDNLRTFTDAAESQANRVNLRDLVQWAVRRKQERTDCDGCVHTQLDEVPMVWASEVGLVQVVWNLLDNALEAVADNDDGAIDLTLQPEDDRVILKVADNGPGMSDEVAARAFEPFYTTKQVGQGAGLGLFVCQGLVEGMDGTIDIETTEGEGTTVYVTLPSAGRATPGADAE